MVGVIDVEPVAEGRDCDGVAEADREVDGLMLFEPVSVGEGV